MTVVFRPRSGLIATWFVAGISVFTAVTTFLADPRQGVAVLPLLALAVAVTWAVLARPSVIVSDGGVTIVNVLRTVELPWPAIQAVDTKWALTLQTAYGPYSAWAAAAPGRAVVRRATKSDVAHLPESTYGLGGIRPGDLPASQSGAAALLIRERWEALRDAGYLDQPVLERAQPRTTTHWPILALIALLAISALAERSTRLEQR